MRSSLRATVSERLDRADRDRRRRIAGRRDAGVSGKAGRRVLAVVAGGGDDDHSGRRRALNRLNQRIGGRGLEDRMSERQVDDVDAQARPVGHREVDRPDDVARVAGAVLVQHFQDDELHVRRQAAIVRVVRQRARSADGSGDVGAMPVVVVTGTGATVPPVVKS